MNILEYKKITLIVLMILFFTSIISVNAENNHNSKKPPGVTDSLILLGQSAAFSGPAASLGKEYRHGATTYFDYINTKGGIYGRRVFLISLDDGYEPERTIANTQQLIEKDHVFSLFGYIGTPTSKSALPQIEKNKIPFFAPFTGAELLRTPVNPLIYNVRASYYQETAALVQHMLQLNKRNIAVFYQDDSYGKAGLEGVKRALHRNNLSISALGTVQRNTIQVIDAVKNISTANPDGVIMIGAYKACAEFIRQAKKMGMDDTVFMNVSFVGSKALVNDLWLASKDVIVSQVVPFPASLNIPIVVEYNMISRFFSDYNLPSYGALEGFIAAKLFVKGLRKAGKNLTRKNFMTALNNLNEVNLGGFQVNWTPENHNGSSFIDVTIIGKNDRWAY
jgi:ABC-type branched-subunit amino acid transport system substrate-binding protein